MPGSIICPVEKRFPYLWYWILSSFNFVNEYCLFVNFLCHHMNKAARVLKSHHAWHTTPFFNITVLFIKIIKIVRPCATQLYKWWQLWPASIGLHEQILNRLELLCSKGMVVSVKVRCEQRRWTKVNRWTSVVTKQVMSKPECGRNLRDKSDRNVLTGQAASGVEAAWSLFRLL